MQNRSNFYWLNLTPGQDQVYHITLCLRAASELRTKSPYDKAHLHPFKTASNLNKASETSLSHCTQRQHEYSISAHRQGLICAHNCPCIDPD